MRGSGENQRAYRVTLSLFQTFCFAHHTLFLHQGQACSLYCFTTPLFLLHFLALFWLHWLFSSLFCAFSLRLLVFLGLSVLSNHIRTWQSRKKGKGRTHNGFFKMGKQKSTKRKNILSISAQCGPGGVLLENYGVFYIFSLIFSILALLAVKGASCYFTRKKEDEIPILAVWFFFGWMDGWISTGESRSLYSQLE